MYSVQILGCISLMVIHTQINIRVKCCFNVILTVTQLLHMSNVHKSQHLCREFNSDLAKPPLKLGMDGLYVPPFSGCNYLSIP